MVDATLPATRPTLQPHTDLDRLSLPVNRAFRKHDHTERPVNIAIVTSRDIKTKEGYIFVLLVEVAGA